MCDIETLTDLEFLIEKFYESVKKEPDLVPFFCEITEAQWPDHIQRIALFWDSALFGKAGYTGNPMQVHLELSKRIPIEPDHFNLWLSLFNQTLEQHFSGENATRAGQRAQSIATVMQIKLLENNKSE